MPKKNTKSKKFLTKKKDDAAKRELAFREYDQQYCQVTKKLGDLRLEVYCFDGVKRRAHVRGVLTYKKNKANIQVGDILLVAVREFQPSKCDVMLQYTEREVAQLKELEELPLSVMIGDVDSLAVDTDELFGAFYNNNDSDEEDMKGKKKKDDEIDIDFI